MAKTSAHTRTYASVAAMANLEVHNTREWTEDHPAPGYLLAEEHQDPRGNIAIRRDLTPEMVIREYLETHPFGQKHGRLHHKAKPLRETVVVCEARHGREDMEKLMTELERQLPFRCMYGYLHRDEGHIDKETGIVKLNWHMHIGHTNLIDGQLVNPGKAGLRKLQDICAEVLGMERGTPVEEREEKRPHLPPKEYRRMARERDRSLAAERTQVKAAQETNKALSAENAELKEALDHLVETNKALRQRLQDSGQGTPQIYKRLKEIKTSDEPIRDRLEAMTRYVDEILGKETPAPGAGQHTRLGVPLAPRWQPQQPKAPAPDTFTGALQDERNRAKAGYAALGELNKTVRTGLKLLGAATQKEYQSWRITLEDQNLSAIQKQEHGVELLDRVAQRLDVYQPLGDFCREAGVDESEMVAMLVRWAQKARTDALASKTQAEHTQTPTQQHRSASSAAADSAPAPAPRGAGRPTPRPSGSGSTARVKSWEEEEEEKRRRRGNRGPGE